MLTANAVGSSFNGEDGDDTFIGSVGNDYLNGGGGDDNISGGGGSDTAGYLGSTLGVVVNLGITGSQDTGGAGIDTLTGIENLDGSEYADILTGDEVNNLIRSYAGRRRSHFCWTRQRFFDCWRWCGHVRS